MSTCPSQALGDAEQPRMMVRPRIPIHTCHGRSHLVTLERRGQQSGRRGERRGAVPKLVRRRGGAMTRPFRFGVMCFTAPSRAAWCDLARQAEALGYATFIMADHYINPFAPVPGLVAAADATRTIRIGCQVFDNDFRHPALLAKEAATVDVLTDGRFEFGLGAGWSKKEYDQVGIPFDLPAVRVSRMEEGLQVIKALWGDEP